MVRLFPLIASSAALLSSTRLALAQDPSAVVTCLQWVASNYTDLGFALQESNPGLAESDVSMIAYALDIASQDTIALNDIDTHEGQIILPELQSAQQSILDTLRIIESKPDVLPCKSFFTLGKHTRSYLGILSANSTAEEGLKANFMQIETSVREEFQRTVEAYYSL